MVRPRNKKVKEKISTTIDKELMDQIRNINQETGIPINRLIENSLRESIKKEVF
ncbi:MAG: ribbon-helix-helix domain-containing protein [archaeon]